MLRIVLAASLLLATLFPSPATVAPSAVTTPYPILFVAQVPIANDFATVASTFGNQRASIDAVPRGGGLWIRYPDGTLRDLTKAAGFGHAGMQDASSIAVRDPAVHWSGTKALFSMVVGAPTRQYEWGDERWQLYEITGLGEHDTPVVTRVPNQPAEYDNVAPLYGTDDRVIFASDRPRGGLAHLYPQLDEYEEAATTTGLWSLDPATGDLRMLNHAPSGVFTPTIDSFGRLLFTRWDHLQRDQQADSDETEGGLYGTFDYADESAGAARLSAKSELFPEPRPARQDLLAGTNLAGHSINHFFPWQINEDGTSEETLNHVGRHELHAYFDRSLTDDDALTEFIAATTSRTNRHEIQNLLQLREDPTRPGVYFGTDAPEFFTHGSGQIVSVAAPPSLTADRMEVDYVTARSTESFPDTDPPADHSGHYRDPLPLSDGRLIVAHTSETRGDRNAGTRANPVSRYAFRLTTMVQQGDVRVAGEPLTPGLHASLSWWDPDILATWEGELWELQPVEVRPRPRPARASTPLEGPELSVFQQEGIDVDSFRADLARRGLAVVVARDVTTRDAADRQQPFNLRVPGGVVHATAAGKVYDVAHLQLFQADQLRGLGGVDDPRPGRRVLARLMHDAPNPASGGPASSVKVAADGSVAAFVPAGRAVSWQTTDPQGTPVVRERYWLSFQPGEVRVCSSCHGVNFRDQVGAPPAQNSPEALRVLLRYWKTAMQGSARQRAVRR